MTYELSLDEKREIIDQNLRRLSSHKFNLEILLTEESSISNPKESIIIDINNQISDCDLKIAALIIKLNEIN